MVFCGILHVETQLPVQPGKDLRFALPILPGPARFRRLAANQPCRIPYLDRECTARPAMAKPGADSLPVLERRKPRLLFRLAGLFLLRLAQRTFLGLLFQLPPRITRLDPPKTAQLLNRCTTTIELYLQGCARAETLHVRQRTVQAGRQECFIYLTVKPALTVMDGVWGMEGHGPGNGIPRRINLIAASKDAVAMDVGICHLLGVPLGSFPLYRAAKTRGIGETDVSQINFMGERSECSSS